MRIGRTACLALRGICVSMLLLAMSFAVADELSGHGRVNPAMRDHIDGFEEPRKYAGPFDLPWGVTFLPDGRLLITEREGRLRVVENGSLMSGSIEGLPVVIAGGHSGLLDVLVDRDFERTQRIFLSYTHGVSGSISMRVMSAVLVGMELKQQKVIFESRPAIAGVDEIGGRLAWGRDGCLYLTLGDRTEKGRAQDLMDHSGSIVRLHSDGSIPEDNPFVGREDALPEIYSYGHRNPQGLLLGVDGRMWAVEHGPYGGDELNLLRAGANYGWPLVTFGIEYDGSKISEHTTAPGLEDPINGCHPWHPPAWRRIAVSEAWAAGQVLYCLARCQGSGW